VQAVVLEEGLEYSLLGMSFLNRLEGWDVTPNAIVIHQ
jgi:aspartyl protease family protein